MNFDRQRVGRGDIPARSDIRRRVRRRDREDLDQFFDFRGGMHTAAHGPEYGLANSV
jgi:hypothetical protein